MNNNKSNINMRNQHNDTWFKISDTWTRSIRDVDKQASIDESTLSNVERQIKISHQNGTIWEAVRKPDEILFERLIQHDRSNVDVRGPMGECPIHMLFLYGTEKHFKLAQYLIIHFPHTLIQICDQDVNFKSFFT